MKKNENLYTRFDLSLYSAQISTNTKIPSIPIIHEGKHWKNHKKEVKRGSKEQKQKMQEAFSQVVKISQQFRSLPNFLQCSIFLAFYALLSFMFLICNAELDSNSSCLDRLNNFGIINLQKL